MTDQMADCEKSFYRELYHYAGDDKSIVMDTISGRICFKKILDVYNVDVFEYLMTHSDIHIPKIRAFWKEDERLVVIEELISGDTLEYILCNNHPTDERRKDYLAQICDGLSFLHRAVPSIIHRDLKPSNIMVTDDGIVKIIDYDAAKIFDENETKDTIQIGTKGSAAPEQYGFGKVDERTDIYSLGILIRQMFPDDMAMLAIADKASELNPKDRYSSVLKLKAQFQTSKQAHKMNCVKALPGFRTGKFWKMIVAVIGYVLLLSIALTLQSKTGNKPDTGLRLWINRIAILGICISLVDLFTNWTGIYHKFPFISSKNYLLKAIGYALAAVIIIFFWAFTCAQVLNFST
ncbi:MAG: serine/threonine-protein kinase [Lachnospiraceae bacterium]|jgi:serine/threonine protein kinase|nr:serine/threonine-protein kinase [Lachnospiraceae bacterium]MDD4524896.1 serine/threonine-protein kinase [Lachnospiraceae bacterium]